jgi:hypothetical protein
VKQIAILLVLAATACGTARSAELYRDDTQHLLATRSSSVRQCYDQALAADPTAAGTVAVAFTVEHKTGAITHATLDAKRTTAPEQLGSCVLEAVRGLVLDPADRHDGNATFVYNFAPPSQG